MSAQTLPRLDLATLDDAHAAVAALDGNGQTATERAALNAVLNCIMELGARPGVGYAYAPDDLQAVDVPGKPGRPSECDEYVPLESLDVMRARWKRNLERAGHDGSWLEAK